MSRMRPPVGFRRIRLLFEIDGDLTDARLSTVTKLTERYRVVYRTPRSPPPVETTLART